MMGPGAQRGGDWGSLHASEYTPSHVHVRDDESVQQGGTAGRGRRNNVGSSGVHGAGCASGNSK